MKANAKIKGLGATLCYTLLSSAILTASAQAQVAQIPLNLSEGVPPNMIFTLDESGSMSWAFVPDMSTTPGSVYVNKIGGGSSYNTRRMRAANANPMYYNPNVIYRIPPTFAQDGTELTLSTSFTNAPINGLWIPSEWNNSAGRGKLDLSTNYRLPWTHRQGTTNDAGTLTYAAHPADFGTQTFAIPPSGNGPHTIGPNEEQQFRYEITRTKGGCSAKVYMGAGNAVVKTPTCSISGNNVTVNNGLTSTGVPAYYYEFEPTFTRSNSTKCGVFSDSSGTGKDAFSQDERCYKIKWVDETSAYDENGNRLKHPDGKLVDGKQNFAIWYSFYRSRALATLSAAKIAFYNLSPDVRFTWQDLATCKTFKSTSGNTCGNNRLKPYSTKHRGEFYTWLRKRYFNTGTPLPAAMKRAGEFLTTAAPWQKTPYATTGNNDDNTYACRPSYHVMMTDGFWNENTSHPSSKRPDHETFTTPGGEKLGGKLYEKQKPFYDSTGSSNPTLADLAMHYWATDLNTNLDNKISPYIPYKNDNSDKEYWDPRNNPAEWQSMSNFIMALGLTTSLNNSSLPWSGSTYSGTGYSNLLAGTSWPAAAKDSANNVYDLWHAAINSRGEFYSVDSPDAMVQAFKDILSRIADRKSSAAPSNTDKVMEVDSSGSDERLASYSYQSSYDSTVWSGDIEQIKIYLEYNQNYRSNAPADDPRSQKFIEKIEHLGKASEKLPAHTERKIYIAGSDGLKEFRATEASAGNKNTQGTLAYYLSFKAEDHVNYGDESWKDRLNYIRGDRSNEGSELNQFRVRGNTVLGDFFASQPAIVSGARYLIGLADSIEGNTAYRQFINQKVKNRTPVMYIGGNAGMLHAFDVNTMKEIFAFIPTSVFHKLNKLTGKNYTHEFYVDGSPVVADVYDKDEGEWRTILVGTLRAGGKGIFALDVTNPGESGEGIKLLWELTESNFPSHVNDENTNVKPGYSFPKPTVARLHNGRWAVVTGNGYKGDGATNGAAALYIIDAITGNMIKYLEVQSPVNNLENGLSTPTLADFDGDGVADYAYAGDLHGNMWRFNLLGEGAAGPTEIAKHGTYGSKNGNDSRFEVGNAGAPLFTARSSSNSIQSITAAPTLVRHPTRRGYLVAFGTGKYFESGDKAGDESTFQTAYAIWDRYTKAESTTVDTIRRSDLKGQNIASVGSGTGLTTGKDRETKTLSKDLVEWEGERYSSASGIREGNKLGWFFDLGFGSNKDGEMVIEKMLLLGNTLFMQTLVPNDDPCTSGSSSWLYAMDSFTGGQTSHHAFDTRGPNDEIVSAIKIGNEGGIDLRPSNDPDAGPKAWDEPLNIDPESVGRQSWRMIQDI